MVSRHVGFCENPLFSKVAAAFRAPYIPHEAVNGPEGSVTYLWDWALVPKRANAPYIAEEEEY